jgi:hypothetical protein
MVKELSVFIDNKPGRLKAVIGLLNEKKINIRALTLQDIKEYGILKIIVDRPNDAYLAISEKGLACAVKEVLAVRIEDRPGGFDELLKVISDKNINIKDTFGFVVESKKSAILCIEVDNIEKAEELLKNAKFHVLEENDLYNL